MSLRVKLILCRQKCRVDFIYENIPFLQNFSDKHCNLYKSMIIYNNV